MTMNEIEALMLSQCLVLLFLLFLFLFLHLHLHLHPLGGSARDETGLSCLLRIQSCS